MHYIKIYINGMSWRELLVNHVLLYLMYYPLVK